MRLRGENIFSVPSTVTEGHGLHARISKGKKSPEISKAHRGGRGRERSRQGHSLGPREVDCFAARAGGRNSLVGTTYHSELQTPFFVMINSADRRACSVVKHLISQNAFLQGERQSFLDVYSKPGSMADALNAFLFDSVFKSVLPDKAVCPLGCSPGSSMY